MLENTTIDHIMSTDVKSILPDTSFEEVDRIFSENNFHHVPVIEEDKRVIGMISKSEYYMLCDHLTLLLPEAERNNNLRFFRSLLAREVMTQPVACLHQDDLISKAAAYFRENRFGAIPILNDDDELVGILSTYDLLSYAFKNL